MLKIILVLLFLNLQTILGYSREEICSMELKKGKCRGRKFDRWYYNKARRSCEKFVYSGCGGNANSFASEHDCLGTCSNICLQPKYRGYCHANTHRFFFNHTSDRCEGFLFGGCGANQNNFLTWQECRTVCQNECTLPPSTGLCRAMMARYYYNMATGNCEMFIYGGCSGNANNFENKRDCEARCVINMPYDMDMLEID